MNFQKEIQVSRGTFFWVITENHKEFFPLEPKDAIVYLNKNGFEKLREEYDRSGRPIEIWKKTGTSRA